MSCNNWILITGGTRGIGRGLVFKLANSGYNVIFTYKSSHDLARKIEKSFFGLDVKVRGIQCDSSDVVQVKKFSETILKEFGTPYGIINNAGITDDALMMRMEVGQWCNVINSNLNSAFFVTQAFLPSMIQSGTGVIIMMSSVSGFKGNIGQTNYSATKAGLIGMSRSLALEVGRFNVRVNSISPGYIDTEMLGAMPDDQRSKIKKNIPLRRIGTVEDVSFLAEFLLSPNASYITGQNFVVDGGLTI